MQKPSKNGVNGINFSFHMMKFLAICKFPSAVSIDYNVRKRVSRAIRSLWFLCVSLMSYAHRPTRSRFTIDVTRQPVSL